MAQIFHVKSGPFNGFGFTVETAHTACMIMCQKHGLIAFPAPPIAREIVEFDPQLIEVSTK